MAHLNSCRPAHDLWEERLRDDEEPLTKRIIELAALYGRYGTPRITALLGEYVILMTIPPIVVRVPAEYQQDGVHKGLQWSQWVSSSQAGSSINLGESAISVEKRVF